MNEKYNRAMAAYAQNLATYTVEMFGNLNIHLK